MALKKLQTTLEAVSPETRLSLLAVVAAMANLWLGLLIGFAAVWQSGSAGKLDLKKHLALWYFAPTVVALGFLSRGQSLPADDLLRHIGAGALGFDYRSQYPWADLPQANLWLGFDWALWQLQRMGLSKDFLRQWVPGLSILLQSAVLFLALRRAVPQHRASAALFLLAGSVGLLLLTQRSLLGRPEMFILIFAATAMLPRSKVGVIAWLIGFLALVPVYWLGWAYAPFALLLWPGRLRLAQRVGLAVALGLAHVAFWQLYTGDYLGLMVWLRSTLDVLATENYPLHLSLYQWGSWIFFFVLAIAVSMLSKRRLKASIGVVLLFLWLCLPNQVRYHASLVFVALPWLYRQLSVLHQVKPIQVRVPAVLFALTMAGALAVPNYPMVPKFSLPATARVHSESPYATVFFGEKGIAVNPSFAFGATRKPWDVLMDATKEGEHCHALREGGFTHLVEKSRLTVLECGRLRDVDGAWRLWELTR